MHRVTVAALSLAACLTASAAIADDPVDAARTFAAPLVVPACKLAQSPDDQIFPLRYRLPGQDQDSPDYRADLVQLHCVPDAVNVGSVFVLKDEQTGALTLLSFAEPKLDYDYEDESFSSLKSPPRIVGYATVTVLSNARFDPTKLELTARRNWRAAGDAWSSGTWLLREGSFVLNRYEIDPNFDKIQPGASQSKPESYIAFQAPDRQ